MKALIIDDEAPARAEMRLLLSAHPEIEITGEAAGVPEALQAIALTPPDVLFLDINLRGASGFEVLDNLPLPPPQVVFCTAYDEHALRAFEVSALDYLLKPIHPGRLARTVGKLLANHERTTAAESGYPAAKGLTLESCVYVREGESCWLVPVSDIELIEAEGNSCRLFFQGRSPLVYRSLSSLEERLPRPHFLRANRSQIINRGFIENIQPWFSHSLKAVLRNGTGIEFSRRAAQVFRDQAAL